MGILRADRITGLGGANVITGSTFFSTTQHFLSRTECGCKMRRSGAGENYGKLEGKTGVNRGTTTGGNTR